MNLLRLALAAAILVAAAPPVSAQPTDTSGERNKANALYKEGVRLFNAGQFADALELFNDAYHRYPDARILFSIATSLRQIGRTVDAANAYQRFVGDPGAEPQFVADSQTVLRVLDATVGKVDVTFDGPAGEVRAEDGDWLPIGTTSVRVQPGRFVVQARRDGFVADTTGRIAAGTSVAVTLTWRPVAAPAPAPIDPPDPGGTELTGGDAAPPADELDAIVVPHHGRRLAAYVAGGSGLALAGAALALELGARGRIDDAEAMCPSLHCSGDTYDATQALLDGARTRRTAAMVMAGAGVAAVAAGIALYVTSRPTERRVHAAPIATAHTVGLAVTGAF